MSGPRIGYRGISVAAAGIRKVADAAERTALTPANGDFVIQLDNDSLYYYNGATWEIYLDDSSYDDLLQVILDLAAHIADGTDAHDASAISFAPVGSIAATDVQAAIAETYSELAAAIAALQIEQDNDEVDLANHITDATDAHDASAISVVPTGNLAADDVQEALDELQGDIDDINNRGYVPAANSAVANGATPDFSGAARRIQRVSGSGGAVVLTDLAITSAEEGDELVLIGTDSTNTVGLVSATNLVLNGSVTLGDDDMLTLVFIDSQWKEQSRSA